MSEVQNSAPIPADAAPEGSGVAELNKMDADLNLPKTGGDPALQTKVEKAIKDGATEAEVNNMIREYEIKVNGKKKSVKIDFNNKEDIVRRLQLAEAGHSAMQEKAELEKMISQELLKAKQNPWDFFKELGLDPDELAEMRIQQRIEEMKKSPEQIEKERITKELEEARAKLAKIEKEKEEATMTQLQEKAAVELESDIEAALKNHPDLPKTRKTVVRLADAMLWAMDNGFPDVRIEDVVPSVKAEIQAEINEMMSAMPEELMEMYIGKKNIERLRKQRIAKAKLVQPVEIKEVAKPQVKEVKEEKKINMGDYFRNLGM